MVTNSIALSENDLATSSIPFFEALFSSLDSPKLFNISSVPDAGNPVVPKDLSRSSPEVIGRFEVEFLDIGSSNKQRDWLLARHAVSMVY